jgi:arylsulfatase A-like enzyme
MQAAVRGRGTRFARSAVVVALFLVGLALFLLHWRRERVRAPNILFLVVDALRSDHLGCMGYTRDTSPTIDRLASRGVLFTHNTSPANYTTASVPSLFTGVFPSVHGVRRVDEKTIEPLSEEFVTLAELLKDRGYATAAYAPNPSLSVRFHLDQGFDAYHDDVMRWAKIGTSAERYETARKMNRAALEWLDGHPDQKFFLYLHYRDVHGPYLPLPPYDTLYWSEVEKRAEAKLRLITDDEYRVLPPYLRRLDDHGALEYYVSQYDGEVRYTDDQLALFLAELDKRGRLDDTVIFLTADHGESFLDHGTWDHGTNLYEEELHTPLIMFDPGAGHSGQRVDAPVQTLDVFPTILELAGIPIPDGGQGQSLRDVLREGAVTDRRIFSEGRNRDYQQLAAVRIGEWKLIYNFATAQAELYDLQNDPRERTNLVSSEPAKSKELLAELLAFEKNSTSLRKGGKESALDRRTIEQLEALGYVQ